MCRSFLTVFPLVFSVLVPLAAAEEALPVAQSTLEEVTSAYTAGDFALAFSELASVPGILAVAPIFDAPEPRERARIFFDLGRIRLAAGDTTRARIVLTQVFTLDPHARKGLLQLPSDAALDRTQAFLSRLRKQAYNQRLRLSSRWGGAFRSLVVPGWGQMYRGHKKKGYLIMGVTAGLAAAWAISDQSYRSAYRAYRNTRIEDLALGRRTGADSDPLPFKTRYERAESRARRADIALAMLAAVWISSVFDNLVVGPAQLSIVAPIR